MNYPVKDRTIHSSQLSFLPFHFLVITWSSRCLSKKILICATAFLTDRSETRIAVFELYTDKTRVLHVVLKSQTRVELCWDQMYPVWVSLPMNKLHLLLHGCVLLYWKYTISDASNIPLHLLITGVTSKSNKTHLQTLLKLTNNTFYLLFVVKYYIFNVIKPRFDGYGVLFLVHSILILNPFSSLAFIPHDVNVA